MPATRPRAPAKLGADKREAIVRAATASFIERGFQKTSIDDVATTAGVGKGTVYLACESKVDLFYQCVMADLHAWSAQIARFVDPRHSASEILTTMARTGVVYLRDHPLVRDLFAGAHEGLFPDWTERFAELRTMGRATVADVLRLGIRHGEFRADLDVDEVAALLQDLQHAGYTRYGQEWAKDVTRSERRINAMLMLVLDGIRVRK